MCVETMKINKFRNVIIFCNWINKHMHRRLHFLSFVLSNNSIGVTFCAVRMLHFKCNIDWILMSFNVQRSSAKLNWNMLAVCVYVRWCFLFHYRLMNESYQFSSFHFISILVVVLLSVAVGIRFTYLFVSLHLDIEFWSHGREIACDVEFMVEN